MVLLKHFSNGYFMLVLVATCHEVACQDWQEALENFTWNKLQNYTTWLSSNNLDPSPTIPGPNLITTASPLGNITYNLSNHGVRHHSTIDFEINSVAADFTKSNLNLDFEHVGGIEYFGNFNAHGVLANGNRVTGNGDWYIKVATLTGQSWGITYTVNPNGFLNPNGFYAEKTFLENIEQVQFGRFFEDEIPPEIKEQLKAELECAFGDYLEQTEDHPLKNLLYQYLQEVFKSTPWPAIIGTPSRPPTSTLAAKF